MSAAEGRWNVNKNTPRVLLSYLCLSFKPWASLLFLIKALETRNKVFKVIRGSVTMTVSCQSFNNCEASLVLQRELCVLDHNRRTKGNERKLLPEKGKFQSKIELHSQKSRSAIKHGCKDGNRRLKPQMGSKIPSEFM